MNTKRLFTVGMGLAIALGAAACNNDKLTNINQNPNSPENVPPTTLFTNSARNTVDRWLGGNNWWYDLRMTEFVAQHLAEVQYPDEDRYTRIGAADTRSLFDNAYSTELEDLQKVINSGKASNDAGVWAPATVLRTVGFMYLTDTWGDIPYSQALAGDSSASIIQPQYDPQQQIYTDFFAKLDAASKALSGASNALGGADPIYAGSPAKWQKFANSLRARLALRIVNVDKATADAQLKAAFGAAGGVITSNADNAKFQWPGNGIYDNPWSQNFQGRDDHRISKTLMDILQANNDPRIPVYAQPTPSGAYAGQPNGLTASKAAAYLNAASRVGLNWYPQKTAYGTFPGAKGPSQPSYIMTAAEVAFIQAEAAERGLGGLNPSQAAGFYKAGITLSMQQWGVSDADIATYLAQPGVAYAGGTAGLKQIGVQKWIALFTDGGTAWAEWRRTCEPETIKPGPDASLSTIPRRFQYSPTEVSANNASLSAAISRQGPDQLTTPVWWDKQPSAAPTYPGTSCGSR